MPTVHRKIIQSQTPFSFPSPQNSNITKTTMYAFQFSRATDSLLHRHSDPHPIHTHFPSLPSPSTISFRPTPRRSPTSTVSATATSTGVADINSNLSFYELLGISSSGSLIEIKQAYKQLARKYHPDVSPPDQVKEYTQRFIMVQEAYETLSDPRRRAMYDHDMVRGVNLAFSARRRYSADEDPEGQSEWKNHWQSQLSKLKRRSSSKEGSGDMSWGARMRRQRNGSSMEC